MDNFLTRLVKRTLGLMPVVQPIIASIFTPTEIILDSYSSGFETDNNTRKHFRSGETAPPLSQNVPSNSPAKISNLSENRRSSLSTFEPLVTSGNNERIVDGSKLEVSNPERSIFTQSDNQRKSADNQADLDIIPNQKAVAFGTPLSPLSQGVISSPIVPESLLPQRVTGEERQSKKANNSGADEFDIEFNDNFNKNISTFSQNPKPTLPSQQQNAFDIPIPAYYEEVTPSQKVYKKGLDQLESLVKQEIETEPHRASSTSLFQEAISSPIVPKSLLPQGSIGEEKQNKKANSPSELDIEFNHNFTKNVSIFSQNPNPTLPNKQLNDFNIVPQNSYDEVTKVSKKSLERVEPLVKGEIKTQRNIETQDLDVQTVRSQLETNPQQQYISTVRYTNDVPRRENPLSRIKSLVHRIFQTQQRRDNNLSSPQERVEIQPNLLPSNLNLQNTSRESTVKIYSMQPTAPGMIQRYRATENTALKTAGQEINSPVNLPPEFFLANSQSNSAITEEIKLQNIYDLQIIKQNISEPETITRIQHIEDLTINQVEHLRDNAVMPLVEPVRGMSNLNQPRNYSKVNNLNISDRDTSIAPSTTSDSQQSQIYGEIQSVNRRISEQQLIQLVPRQSTDRSSTVSEPINAKHNNPNRVLSNSDLEQAFILASKQLHFGQLAEDVSSDKQENPRLGNKERPEIKVYAISSGNEFISEQTPILISSKLKVNQKSELEPQTSSDVSRFEKERDYHREFAFLTRRSLSVLSQSSSKQSSVDPIANNLLEFKQLNSTNRREVANADRTTWQNVSDAETTIQITIGRLEVRTNNQPTSSTPKSKSNQRGPTVSLQDYLKQRQGEK